MTKAVSSPVQVPLDTSLNPTRCGRQRKPGAQQPRQYPGPGLHRLPPRAG